MNDPGLDQPMSNAVDVAGELKGNENEQESLSIWWFPFPLFAGTFGPMASAFSICSLVVPWIVWVPPGQDEADEKYIDNPKWLTIVHAIQLALAFLSNLFLYLNMARRVSFSVAQPIVIVGWYISSIALIALICMVERPLKPAPQSDYAFTQAFYYATFSAGLYFLDATMMVVTVVGKYKGHYDEEFRASMSQGTLMLQTVVFLFYLLIGAVVYSHIEGWAYLDAVYWADNTILTVGLGDFVPTTNLGRGLLFPFAIGGIVILGLIVCSIRTLVVERGKEKVGARTMERQRQRVLRKLQKQAKSAVLTPNHPATDAQNILRTSLGSFSQNQDHLPEQQWRKQEFDLMRLIQHNTSRNHRWISLLISGSIWFILWLVSALVFKVTEKAQSWSYFESVYFAYTSLLTIGYGDPHPESNSGKAFFVFWSLLAIPSQAILISNMGDTIVEVIRDVPLWVGKRIILPTERRVKDTLKRAVLRAKKKKGLDVEKTLSDVARETTHNTHPTQDSNLGSTAIATRSLLPPVQREGTEIVPEVLSQRRSDRNYLLIKEIGTIMKNIKNSPPRKYTFQEWAYYLELLGEDNLDDSAPTRLLRQPNQKEARLTTVEATGIGNKREQGEERRANWSWTGKQSPLMGQKEESEWLLERLTKTLERELREDAVIHD